MCPKSISLLLKGVPMSKTKTEDLFQIKGDPEAVTVNASCALIRSCTR